MNPDTLELMNGTEFCTYQFGEWVSKLHYVNPDQPRFRTLGKNVGIEVNEENIKCLAKDMHIVLTGSEDCWPYPLRDQTMDGVD